MRVSSTLDTGQRAAHASLSSGSSDQFAAAASAASVPFAASAASRSRELLRRRRGELRLELRGSTADKCDEPRATKTSTAEARSTVAW